MFKKFFYSFVLFFIFLNSAFANVDLNNQSIKNIEKYLNNIKYFQARFVQDDIYNSKLSEGVFYLSRPGKLRVDYNNPFEATLYSDYRSTIYYDKELDEVSSVRTSSTPLYFLLKDNISFNNKSYSVIDFQEESDNLIISFKENGKEEQGVLTLKFKKNPLILSSIKLSNDGELDIEMMLFDVSTKAIDKSIFVFKRNKK